jgi:hypothetical protein
MKITFKEMGHSQADAVMDALAKATPKPHCTGESTVDELGRYRCSITALFQEKDFAPSSSFTKEERVWMSVYRASLNNGISPDCAKFNATQAVADFKEAFPV